MKIKYEILIEKDKIPELEKFLRGLETRANFGIDARDFLNSKNLKVEELNCDAVDEIYKNLTDWRNEKFMVDVYRQVFIDENVGYEDPSEEVETFIFNNMGIFSKLRKAKSNEEIDKIMTTLYNIYKGEK